MNPRITKTAQNLLIALLMAPYSHIDRPSKRCLYERGITIALRKFRKVINADTGRTKDVRYRHRGDEKRQTINVSF
jgi:hypothetical protein